MLCGVSELSEIVIIKAMDADIQITGIFDQDSSLKQINTIPVWNDFSLVGDFDTCFLADLNSPYEHYKFLVGMVGKERVLIPDVLGIKRESESA